MSAKLPSGRSSASAVWDGEHAYLFGGFDGQLSDDIWRYDPETDSVITMGEPLPSARSATSAAWGDGYAYIFGGFTGLLSDQIVRYDPKTDTAITLTVKLPSARSETTAVWADSAAYVIGGFGGTLLDEIVRIDPASGTRETMVSKLPSGRSGPAAVWTGESILIFGGSQGGTQILSFDPATDDIETMTAQLPSARYRAAAAWDGHFAYVFGGNDGEHLSEIIRYDPIEDVAIQLPLTLPKGRSEAAAIAAGHTMYIFGGCCDGANLLKDVVSVDSANGVPVPEFSVVRTGQTVSVDASAARDPDGALVTFEWDWGDGSDHAGDAKANHTYATLGIKTIQLTITDNRGLSTSVELDVPITEFATTEAPQATQRAFLEIPYAQPAESTAAEPTSDAPEPEPSDAGEVGGQDARDRSGAGKQAPKTLGSRLAHALSDSWSEAPGLFMSVTLLLAGTCTAAAVFLFRYARRDGPLKATLTRHEAQRPRPPPT